MTNTYYANPHGLHNKDNYSSVYDVSLVSTECIKVPLFRKVVRT